ncbi:archaeosortase A [Archaeoglobus veneficus]|uniref:Exosortase EpsH-related protein n=1 Tax=Archaeoglobus veneficus (strain DSM 11195 / SNP6) TaxID=693661 RepID=F2KPJ9_ARCVS|nr:archaeosortase A [Archaeoglobus veneficus]AEA46430.1 Exosortase EpsH-related protein [Archaeoglobus veneficus SNP6]
MDLPDTLVMVSIAMMLAFIASKLKIAGFFAWFTFGIAWLLKVPYYLSIGDYYNVVVLSLAFAFFLAVAIRIIRTDKLDVFIDVTSFSAVAALVYFTFALTPLGNMLIHAVATQTALVGSTLGFGMVSDGEMLFANSKRVEIILACTGIESMALFTGATLGIKAEWRRKVKAFLISVPVIYILNILRNVFVMASYAYSWFGENSFYIAHHVISKFLATIALILISLAVFRFLPELEELIFSLKDSMVGR